MAEGGKPFVTAFLIAGLTQTMVTQRVVTRWLGDGTGWRGIALACLGGALIPGGPYVYYPIAAALLHAGAGLGVLVAFVTAKNLWSVTRLPRLVQSWIGPASGWQGLVLGEAAGMLLPGGPYVVFPLISALCRAGAGLGPAVAIVTAWAMSALLSISFELPFMGWRFTAVRWGLGHAFPVLAGLLAQVLFADGF